MLIIKRDSMSDVIVFIVAGSLLQFEDYCRCKEFRPVQKSVWEDYLINLAIF